MGNQTEIETVEKIISDLNTDLCYLSLCQDTETRGTKMFSIEVQIKAMEKHLDGIRCDQCYLSQIIEGKKLVLQHLEIAQKHESKVWGKVDSEFTCMERQVDQMKFWIEVITNNWILLKKFNARSLRVQEFEKADSVRIDLFNYIRAECGSTESTVIKQLELWIEETGK